MGFKPRARNIIAGNVLVAQAIQSQNYQAGTSGWTIKQDGTSEFQNITARGTIIADNGNTVISNTGIHVAGTNRQWDVNSSSGFLSRRLPDDGTKGQIFDAGFFINGPTPTPNAFTIGTTGRIFAGNATTGSDDAPFVNVTSPALTGKPGTAGFYAQGQSGLSATDNSQAIITGHDLTVNATTIELFGVTTFNGRLDYATPFCELACAGGGTVTSGGNLDIPWDTASGGGDPFVFHLGSSADIIPNVPGLYAVQAEVIFAFNTSTSYAAVAIKKNGSIFRQSGNLKPTTTNNVNCSAGQVFGFVRCNGTSDAIRINVQQTGTASQTLNTAAGAQSHVTVLRISS